MAAHAEPFRIDIPEGDLVDLRRRLQHTRWPEDFGNEDWHYGVERSWLEEMVEYWLTTYDWRAQEAQINSLPNFKVELGGLPLHFVHVAGRGPSPLPLIATHGWPWTFWDMKDIIGPLSDPAAYGGDPADAFDVVVPSLPGYGFSTPLRRTGVDVAVIADRWKDLMVDVLGYGRFGAYGGDWGSMVTARLGHAHPDRLIGVEMSLPHIPGLARGDLPPEAWAEDEQWMRERMAETEPLIRSHIAVHTRDPQTLAYALSDSPVGTAAWLWERRRAWSDCGGDVLSVFDRDHLITTAAIYWLTGTISTSLRLYYEHFNHLPPLLHDRFPVIEVPTGYTVFQKELIFVPRSAAAERTNLARWTVLPDGGHFGPAEQPAAIVNELREFFRPLR
jgi:pimeloyl-ACP methyl ester carboxylesterase